MRRALSIFFGIVFIVVGLIRILPLLGISVIISGFNFEQWFPVVFVMIGILELTGKTDAGWIWGLALICYGALLLLQSLHIAIPFLNPSFLLQMIPSFFVLIYGIKALAVSE